MKSFYKSWSVDLSRKVRPKFKSPPTLTGTIMKKAIELLIIIKLPHLIEHMSECQKNSFLDDMMYLIYVSHYKKKEPFLLQNDPRFTIIRNTDEMPSERSTE
jgi:hypothetical protein